MPKLPEPPERPLLGILGGLGPLASAAFVRTLYRQRTSEREQDAPRCILLSDPTFPDRTEALTRGEDEVLAARLTEGLETLVAAGADRLVIACFTIHAVLDRVPRELRRRVVSLVDTVVEEVAALPAGAGPLLLLTTSGSRRSGLFSAHPRWHEVESRLRSPDPSDQEGLHRRLYGLKGGAEPAEMLPWLAELRARYEVSGFVFGCTEMHLVQEPLGEHTGWLVVDALMSIARSTR